MNGERITVNKVNFVTILSHAADTEPLQKSHTIDDLLRQSWGIFLLGAGKMFAEGSPDHSRTRRFNDNNLINNTASHMKKIKLLTAGLLAMFAINFASARTNVTLVLTGSTAFRNATVNAIQNILNPGYVWACSGTTAGNIGANQQVFVGQTKDGKYNVIIQTAWAGSASGIYAVAQPGAQTLIQVLGPLTGVTYNSNAPIGTGPSAATLTGDSTALTAGGVNVGSVDYPSAATAQVALSDIFVNTSSFHGPGYNTLADTHVGVVPFEWVKCAYTPDGGTTLVPTGYPGVSNIGIDQAQELVGGGLALSQFTGNASDAGVFVQCVGRDHDSGTRNGAYADALIAGPFEASVIQYQVDGGALPATDGSNPLSTQSAGGGVIETLFPWPVETVANETRVSGSEGFFSGSNVKAVLNRDVDTSAGNYIISYLGLSDASGVDTDTNSADWVTTTDGAGNSYTYKPSLNALTYDGYFPGSAGHEFEPPYTNILNGQYSYWGYEHYLYNAASLSTDQTGLAGDISTQLKSEADFGGVGILLTAMKCSRGGDGAPITVP